MNRTGLYVVLALGAIGALVIAAAAAFTASRLDPGPGGGRPVDGATIPMRLGIAIPSYVHAVAWIGRDEGCFAARGLDVDVRVMGGSSATMRALVGEGIDVGLAGGDAVIRANRAGADLVVVGGLVGRFYHRIVGRSEIESVAALRGRTVGVPFFGGPQDVAVRYSLRRAGLDDEADLTVRSVGKELNRMAALQRGDIDATTSQAPPSVIAELGLRVLDDLPATDEPFPYVVVVVRRETLATERPLVAATLAALADATARYRDPSNRGRALEVIAASLASRADTTGAAAERYETAGPSLLSPTLAIDRAGFELVQRFLGPPASGTAEAELDALLDGSVLAELAEPPDAGDGRGR